MHLAYWDNSRDTFGRICGTIYMLKCAVEYNVVTQNSFQVKERHGHPQSYHGHSIVGWNRKRVPLPVVNPCY